MGMNKLPEHKRITIMRSISRVVGVSINTVTKLLVDAGIACDRIHNERVRGVEARRVQCDEIWSFCYAKARNVARAEAAPEGAGDVWTWTGLDSDTKLVVPWLVGGRDSGYALEFMDDLRDRLANRVQLSTDGHKAYLEAVEYAFGPDVDYAQLIKLYGSATDEEERRRVLPRTVYRGSQGSSVRSPRYGRAEYILCRTPQPHDADVHEALHPSDQRLL